MARVYERDMMTGSRWYMEFQFKGRRYHEDTGQSSRKDAELYMKGTLEKLRQAHHAAGVAHQQSIIDAALGLPVAGEPDNKMTLAEGIDIALKERPDWQENKQRNRAEAQLKVVAELLGPDRPIEGITKRDLNLLRNRLAEAGGRGEDGRRSKLTVNRYMASLSAVFTYLRDDAELIGRAPKVPKASEKGTARERVLTLKEEDLLLEEYQKRYPKSVGLLVGLFDSGCRCSELTMLPGHAVDLSRGTLTVMATNAKGKKARTIPIATQRFFNVLQAALQANPGLPFGHLNADKMSKQMKIVRKHLKLGEDVVVHAIRHTVAVRLLSGGMDIYSVKEWMGHSTIMVTERYLHLVDGRLVQGREILGGVDVDLLKSSGGDCYPTQDGMPNCIVPRVLPPESASKSLKSLVPGAGIEPART